MNTIELLQNHRSVRRYQDRAIPQDVLERIMDCGMRGPNTGNMQIYSIVVAQEPELKAQLSQLHFGQGSTCAAYITVCVDINRYHHWCRLRGCDEPYDNFLWLMSGTVDASICAQNICIAAEAEGLGCCYLGTVQYNTAKIAQLLALPKGVVPVVCLSMGYPDENPSLSERLPMNGVVHYEKYHDYSDADIERVHEVREQFPFNQEMVRQNKTRNLAELFTSIRYPKATNVSVSRDLLDFVKQAGFMNQ